MKSKTQHQPIDTSKTKDYTWDMAIDRINEFRNKEARRIAEQEAAAKEKAQVNKLAQGLIESLDAAVSSHPDTVVVPLKTWSVTHKPKGECTAAYRSVDRNIQQVTGPIKVRTRLIYPRNIIYPTPNDKPDRVLISFPGSSNEAYLLNNNGDQLMGYTEHGESSLRSSLTRWSFLPLPLSDTISPDTKQPFSLDEAQKLRDQVVNPLLMVFGHPPLPKPSVDPRTIA